MTIAHALLAAVLALVLAGCGGNGGARSPAGATVPPPASPGGASPADASPTVAPASAGPAASPAAPRLPSALDGFPVHPEAVSDAGAVDPPAVVAAWVIPHVAPPEVYQFYLDELPAAGFTIEGAFPGGEAAIVRFTAPDGSSWQLDFIGPEPERLRLGPPHP